MYLRSGTVPFEKYGISPLGNSLENPFRVSSLETRSRRSKVGRFVRFVESQFTNFERRKIRFLRFVFKSLISIFDLRAVRRFEVTER